jgi:hypothetical protein
MSVQTAALGAAVGIVLILLGAAVAFGVSVPGLTLVSGSHGQKYSLTQNGYNATLHDESTLTGVIAPGCQGCQGDVWSHVSWGDGSNTNIVSTGGTVTHTYSKSGTFIVTENWYECLPPNPNHDLCGAGWWATHLSASITIIVPFVGVTDSCAVTPNYSVQTLGLNASFTDLSTAVSPTKITGITWSFGDGSNATAAVGSTVHHPYAATGNYSFTDSVSAINGTTQCPVVSAGQTMFVGSNSAIYATIKGPTTIAVNHTGVFTVTTVGGSGTYSYSFHSSYSGKANGNTYTITPTVSGSGTIYAYVNDSSKDPTATTNTAPYTVGHITTGGLTASITGPSVAQTGVAVMFTVTAIGGDPPYKYAFNSTVAGTASGSSYTITPLTTGSATISATVTDSGGNLTTTNVWSYSISTGTTSCTPSSPCTVTQSSTSAFTYNLVSGLLFLAGVASFIALVIPGIPIWVRVGVAVILPIAGAVSGYFVGGV